MKNAIILHGTGGSPEGNWFRWLEAELRQKGLGVWLPQLPHAELPSLLEWLDFVRRDFPFDIDEGTLVVGHSSGATLALLLAAESHHRPCGVVAVSPFIPISTSPYTATSWEKNARLFDAELDLEGTLRRLGGQNNTSAVTIVHSDDDPYIPLGVAERIANLCGGELVVIPGQGHFNLEKGPEYAAFPALMHIVDKKDIDARGTLVQVVDEDDNPIGGATKAELHANGLRHRVSRIILEDEGGNVLLRRRRDNDGRIWEGCWDTSAAGHVDEGEAHYEAALREMSEEIGLTDIVLNEVAHYKTDGEYKGRLLNRWNRLYRAVIPQGTSLHLQEEEVAEVKWFTPDELRQLVEDNPDKISDGLLEAYKIMYRNGPKHG